MKYIFFIIFTILGLFLFYKILSYGELQNQTNLEIREAKKSEAKVNNLLNGEF